VTGGDVLNIGSSDNISIQELAETVRGQIALDLAIEYESARETDADDHGGRQRVHRVVQGEPGVGRAVSPVVVKEASGFPHPRSGPVPLKSGETAVAAVGWCRRVPCDRRSGSDDET